MLRVRAEESDVGEELIKHIVEYRFRQKKNTFIAICGGPGEGKSYTALRIAELIQPDFNVKEQVIYYPQQFLSAIEEAKKRNFRVIVLDEAHTTVPARLWYSFTNLAISLVASTFRQLKTLVVVVVAPNVNWIEKSIREMMNYYGVVFRREGSPAYLKFYEVGFNYFDLRDQNPYLKRITFNFNKKIYKLNVLEVKEPSEQIQKDYETFASEYKKKLIEKQLQDVTRKIEKATEVSAKNLDEIIDTLIANQKLLASITRKGKEGLKVKKYFVKSLFKLSDIETAELEQRLIDKLKAIGWI